MAPVSDDAPTTARDRFGSQKAISSDMYFERGAYDPTSAAEGRVRLQQFQGATSISSNQYFGREEEEAAAEGSDGLLGDGSLAGLETAARDAVTRIMANPDVQNLGDSLRSGALKVCDPFSRDICKTNSGCSVGPALGLSCSDVRTLVLVGTWCGICGWDGKEVMFSFRTRHSLYVVLA